MYIIRNHTKIILIPLYRTGFDQNPQLATPTITTPSETPIQFPMDSSLNIDNYRPIMDLDGFIPSNDGILFQYNLIQ